MTRLEELEAKALSVGLNQDEKEELTDLVRARIVSERNSRQQQG